MMKPGLVSTGNMIFDTVNTKHIKKEVINGQP